ncbi:MAG: hypothetical protein LBQ54_10115 [Planctomycetaceae bacterium]|jgi:hypothetical protein|nr:hypothetical protein [Planctomycetaceae bacterium]
MFDEILRKLLNTENGFRESVRDEFGMRMINDLFEPVRNETKALVLMHEELENSLMNLESLHMEIRGIV